MKNNFLTSFQILKNNMLYIQPLLLYMLIVMMVPAYIVSKTVLPLPKICLMISVFLLSSAFLSGWFFINKKAVDDYNPDDDKETVVSKSIKNLKLYFQGVGANFLRILLGILILICIYSVFAFFIYKAGMIYIGSSDIFYDLTKLSVQNQQDLINYINTTTLPQQLIFIKWVLLYSVFILLMHFFATLYLAVIIFEKNNIFHLLYKTIVFIFKNILGCIGIILWLFLIYIILNVISALLGVNSLAFAVSIILFSFYLNYYILLVFCFYNDKTKSNSDNGPEFIG